MRVTYIKCPNHRMSVYSKNSFLKAMDYYGHKDVIFAAIPGKILFKNGNVLHFAIPIDKIHLGKDDKEIDQTDFDNRVSQWFLRRNE